MMLPSREQAMALLREYNADPFHLRHGEIVEGVMRYFAGQRGEDPEFWGLVGLLHDLDFERYPEKHCLQIQVIMRHLDYDEALIRACASHGYGMTDVQFQPEHIMEKVLFAVDELTGLIGAVAIMRPSKSVSDLETPSVKKKFKDRKFAAGCSRDVIQKGADMLGMSLEDLITETIAAMRSLPEALAP
jgi:predicted hydrolase (HD superfamily)